MAKQKCRKGRSGMDFSELKELLVAETVYDCLKEREDFITHGAVRNTDSGI